MIRIGINPKSSIKIQIITLPKPACRYLYPILGVPPLPGKMPGHDENKNHLKER
jgi:hypothetical protein